MKRFLLSLLVIIFALLLVSCNGEVEKPEVKPEEVDIEDYENTPIDPIKKALLLTDIWPTIVTDLSTLKTSNVAEDILYALVQKGIDIKDDEDIISLTVDAKVDAQNILTVEFEVKVNTFTSNGITADGLVKGKLFSDDRDAEITYNLTVTYLGVEKTVTDAASFDALLDKLTEYPTIDATDPNYNAALELYRDGNAFMVGLGNVFLDGINDSIFKKGFILQTSDFKIEIKGDFDAKLEIKPIADTDKIDVVPDFALKDCEIKVTSLKPIDINDNSYSINFTADGDFTLHEKRTHAGYDTDIEATLVLDATIGSEKHKITCLLEYETKYNEITKKTDKIKQIAVILLDGSKVLSLEDLENLKNLPLV